MWSFVRPDMAICGVRMAQMAHNRTYDIHLAGVNGPEWAHNNPNVPLLPPRMVEGHVWSKTLSIVLGPDRTFFGVLKGAGTKNVQSAGQDGAKVAQIFTFHHYLHATCVFRFVSRPFVRGVFALSTVLGLCCPMDQYGLFKQLGFPICLSEHFTAKMEKGSQMPIDRKCMYTPTTLEYLLAN